MNKEKLLKEETTTCECGNAVQEFYAVTDEDGAVSCPKCHQEWLNSLIKLYQEVLAEFFNSEFVNKQVLKKLSKITFVDVGDLRESEWAEQFLIKTLKDE